MAQAGCATHIVLLTIQLRRTTAYTTAGGKTTTRHLVRESYRRGGKLLKGTLANLSHAGKTARTAPDSPRAEGAW